MNDFSSGVGSYLMSMLALGGTTILGAKYYPLSGNIVLSGVLWYLIYYSVAFWSWVYLSESPLKRSIMLFFKAPQNNLIMLCTLFVLCGTIGLTRFNPAIILLYSILGYSVNMALVNIAMERGAWNGGKVNVGQCNDGQCNDGK